MQCVDVNRAHALHGVAASREIERLALERCPPYALIRRAGLSVARLALATSPHACHIWVACGPGRNGDDGLEAALALHHLGKKVTVTMLRNVAKTSENSDVATVFDGDSDLNKAKGATTQADPDSPIARAQRAGIAFATHAPQTFDLCIDALLGLGISRPPAGAVAEHIQHMNASTSPILCVDLPSGLDADTGFVAGQCVRASVTLSLLTLKPGLFTAHGRDVSGCVWFDPLQSPESSVTEKPMQTVGACHLSITSGTATAHLVGRRSSSERLHSGHKGSYGDVVVLGGENGMVGAAVLAASAALYFGAGRVYVCLVAGEQARGYDTQHPELMFRTFDAIQGGQFALVCGCGGGEAIRALMPQALAHAGALVLDADAINLIAIDAHLQKALEARAKRDRLTVVTPHPLEAARLLGCQTLQIQQNRLSAAQQLANRFSCVVVLKGSGTVIAAPDRTPSINPTGNPRLATAGTGDVLAGMIGARLAQGDKPFDAACHSVREHGRCADDWPPHTALTASALARSLTH